MSEPLEKPSATARKSASAREEEGPAPAAKERWYRRWYGRLQSLFAGIAFRGKRTVVADEEAEAHGRGKPDPEAQEEAAPPPRRLRGILLMLAVALLAGALGTGITYSLLTNIVRDQAAKLALQTQQIRALGLQEQAQAVKLAEVMAKLEAERALRLKAESGDSDVKEPQAATSTAPLAPLAQPRQPTADNSGNANKPSRGGTFRPPAAPKVADCNLVNGDTAALKRCLDEFNRK